MDSRSISRRRLLRGAGAGAALLLGSGLDVLGRRPVLIKPAAASSPAARAAGPAQMEPGTGSFVPDAEIAIAAAEKWVQILPGQQTRVWGYEGRLLGGADPSGVSVEAVPDSYLGPIIRVPRGKKLRLVFHNNLSEESVIHPHGLRVPESCDGHPMRAIGPGESLVYEFPVIDRAGPYWFHPHPHMRTAYQVLMGLAGLLYVTDPEEEAAVPGAGSGANDVPVVIQDRTFDSNNQFVYQPNTMWGFLGDRILVNGRPNAAFSLEPRAYRLRILNGSNARTYKLAWSNGMPVQVIGTDGGLLPAVASRSYVTLMPGERVDVWADFGKLAGKQVVLRSLSFSPGGGMMGGGGGMGGGGMGGGGMGGGGRMHGGMGGGGMGGGGMGGGMDGGGMMGSALPNGAALDVLTVNVGRRASVKPVLGPLPALGESYDRGNVGNWDAPVPFVLGMQHMVWTINGRVYNMDDMTDVAEDEMVHLDEPIAWEWVNSTSIPHPMHIHNVQFRVVKRTPSTASSYATVNQGFVDAGWKDTVLVWPGERVKIAMRFGPDAGMYMYHCHILEHEDMGMMRNLMVMAPM